MFVSLAAKIGKARDYPPRSRKQSRPVKTIFTYFPVLGKVLVGAGVLLNVELMTRRGAAFTELMRCARALVFTGGLKLATMQNRLRIPITIRTPRKASLVFILYRHRRRHSCAIQPAVSTMPLRHGALKASDRAQTRHRAVAWSRRVEPSL